MDTLTMAALDDVLALPGITVIDFWAPWCGPCAIPTLEALDRIAARGPVALDTR